MTDPLTPLKNKLAGSKVQFSLKPVTISTVKNIMKSMKMKKSGGPDEISQECLLIGRYALAKPLTNIINASIKQGKVPDSWKEAVVIPIFKKGDAQI